MSHQPKIASAVNHTQNKLRVLLAPNYPVYVVLWQFFQKLLNSLVSSYSLPCLQTVWTRQQNVISFKGLNNWPIIQYGLGRVMAFQPRVNYTYSIPKRINHSSLTMTLFCQGPVQTSFAMGAEIFEPFSLCSLKHLRKYQKINKLYCWHQT